MTFYKVEFSNEDGASAGAAWFTNKRDANKAAREASAITAKWNGAPVVVDTVRVFPTRTGILRALNTYASHPDNG